MKKALYYIWLNIHSALRIILSGIIGMSMCNSLDIEQAVVKTLAIILTIDLSLFVLNVILYFSTHKYIRIL